MTQRLFRHSFLGLFDGPDTNSSTSRRDSANAPSQALFLMNSSFVREQAEALADRVKDSGDDASRIRRIYQLAYSRKPDAEELESLLGFLRRYREAADEGKAKPMVALCRAILTSNELFFVD